MTYPVTCRECSRLIPEGSYFCGMCGLIVETGPLYEPCPRCHHRDPIARSGRARAWVKEHGPWYLGPVFVLGLIPSLRWLFVLGAVGTAATFGLAFWVHRGVRRQCPKCGLRF